MRPDTRSACSGSASSDEDPCPTRQGAIRPRPPLNFITGFTRILADELAGPLNPQQHAYLAKIQNGSDRMLALVNNLLDMSRLQAGKLSLDKQVAPYDSVLEDAVSMLRPLADHKDIDLTCDLPQPLVASLDPEPVTQVLTNLVENAIKFTPTGGAVKVAAFERDGEVVRTRAPASRRPIRPSCSSPSSSWT